MRWASAVGRDPARGAVPLRSLVRLADIRLAGLRPCSRREAYHADITYGTNNEFGFDYLRDNMRFSLEEMVQREHHYAIVDEVDSILIDEARTPADHLRADPSAEGSGRSVRKVDRIIPKLKRAATIVEGKLSEIEEQAPGRLHRRREVQGRLAHRAGDCPLRAAAQRRKPLRPGAAWMHHVHQALKAHHIFEEDVDYVVKEGAVDEAGRVASGRRSSSSTSSPADSCRAGAGRTVCTKRSRPRKASRSRRRTRRSPRSPFRTTSGCTTSLPA